MKEKAKTLRPEERLASLTLDDMSTLPGYTFDTKTGKCYGQVTLPGNTGDVNHGLVLMLGGLSTGTNNSQSAYS